jgi:hypothetical protein
LSSDYGSAIRIFVNVNVDKSILSMEHNEFTAVDEIGPTLITIVARQFIMSSLTLSSQHFSSLVSRSIERPSDVIVFHVLGLFSDGTIELRDSTFRNVSFNTLGDLHSSGVLATYFASIASTTDIRLSNIELVDVLGIDHVLRFFDISLADNASATVSAASVNCIRSPFKSLVGGITEPWVIETTTCQGDFSPHETTRVCVGMFLCCNLSPIPMLSSFFLFQRLTTVLTTRVAQMPSASRQAMSHRNLAADV